MQTKKQRHSKILEIINNNNIDKQEEIVEILKSAGFNVTQATVSRDIHDLRLIKEPMSNGIQRYAQSLKIDGESFNIKLHEIFSHSVINVDYANNIIVIKTLSGMAQAAASAVDAINSTEIMGCIAGDDTIMVITKNENDAQRICSKLNNMRG